jgi:thiol-disulfide isomerase/thioredoxin
LEFRGLLGTQEKTLVNETFVFGQLIELDSADDFLSQVDNEHASVTVFIHWIHPELPLCKSLNKHFYRLARKYPTHKWCFANVDTIPGSELDAVAYPAIFCYKGGELVHTALRYVDQIRTWNGIDCELEDIEDILIKAQWLKEEDIALGQ